MLEEKSVIETITICESGQIIVVEACKIFKDGQCIASIPKPRTLSPGDNVEKEPRKIQALIKLCWTDEILKTWEISKQGLR